MRSVIIQRRSFSSIPSTPKKTHNFIIITVLKGSLFSTGDKIMTVFQDDFWGRLCFQRWPQRTFCNESPVKRKRLFTLLKSEWSCDLF